MRGEVLNEVLNELMSSSCCSAGQDRPFKGRTKV
jgi:hypothetical protein